ncbi:MAG: hypothetical protein R3E83_13305 [Burkholderiaceae bacterium]
MGFLVCSAIDYHPDKGGMIVYSLQEALDVGGLCNSRERIRVDFSSSDVLPQASWYGQFTLDWRYYIHYLIFSQNLLRAMSSVLDSSYRRPM